MDRPLDSLTYLYPILQSIMTIICVTTGVIVEKLKAYASQCFYCIVANYNA